MSQSCGCQRGPAYRGVAEHQVFTAFAPDRDDTHLIASDMVHNTKIPQTQLPRSERVGAQGFAIAGGERGLVDEMHLDRIEDDGELTRGERVDLGRDFGREGNRIGQLALLSLMRLWSDFTYD